MKYRRKLFFAKKPYDLQATDDVFVKAMKENIVFHRKKCPEYGAILANLEFDPNSLKGVEDLHKIPPLPTSYLKNNTLLSKKYNRLIMKVTSSGTSGKKTLSGFDVSSGLCELSMIFRVFSHHKMITPKLTNYIILGYRPDKSNQTAMAKSLAGFTLLAPAKKVVYAIRYRDGEYKVNIKELVTALEGFAGQNRPVRIVGLPAYFKMLMDELNERGVRLSLHKDSIVLLGGGWKALFADEVSKEELFRMANETLGIHRRHFKDHFGTAEHLINYMSCENFHFHVPAFSRVVIRDVRTLEPVSNGTPGLLNLITPISTSVPFGSVLTDDVAVMRGGSECGCGLESPYFEIIGRVGLASVKTCAQTASEFLNNVDS